MKDEKEPGTDVNGYRLNYMRKQYEPQHRKKVARQIVAHPIDTVATAWEGQEVARVYHE